MLEEYTLIKSKDKSQELRAVPNSALSKFDPDNWERLGPPDSLILKNVQSPEKKTMLVKYSDRTNYDPEVWVFAGIPQAKGYATAGLDKEARKKEQQEIDQDKAKAKKAKEDQLKKDEEAAAAQVKRLLIKAEKEHKAAKDNLASVTEKKKKNDAKVNELVKEKRQAVKDKIEEGRIVNISNELKKTTEKSKELYHSEAVAKENLQKAEADLKIAQGKAEALKPEKKPNPKSDKKDD